MAGETVITVVGNLTADPEIRTIGGGAAARQLYDRLHSAHLEP